MTGKYRTLKKWWNPRQKNLSKSVNEQTTMSSISEIKWDKDWSNFLGVSVVRIKWINLYVRLWGKIT